MQDSNSVMLEVTSIRNLRPREGREAMHLVFSPALFPPASGGLREGPFLASNIFCDSGRDRDFVSKEERLSSGYLFYIIYERSLPDILSKTSSISRGTRKLRKGLIWLRLRSTAHRDSVLHNKQMHISFFNY